MSWLALALGMWSAGAVLAFLARRRERVATALAVATTVGGAACLALAAVPALLRAASAWQAPGALPFGPWALRLDPLCAVFLLPIAAIGGLGAVYAPGYFHLGEDAEHGSHAGPSKGGALAAFEFLLVALALVATAANMLLLLVAWELMTMTSWVLITTHHREAPVRSAGLFYLVAGQVSAGALLLVFVALAQSPTGWVVPTALLAAGPALPPTWALAALLLVGFGTKAALAPLHVWLPDAHAAAPSHVSALLSGVMITLGFYGLLRFLPVLGPPSPLLAVVILGLGALGAVGGILMALSQRDVKRVLAYSTIENAGLMALSTGAALLATTLGQPTVAAIAWTAALLHVWSHALSKSLLFFTAGAIAKRVHTRDLERWGGLLRRIPVHGSGMVLGAAALVGLPGTHGFASEWLLLMGLLTGSQALAGAARLPMVLGVVAVAFVAGVALACFVRLVGIGLLGQPRSAASANPAPERGLGLAAPTVVLVAASLAFTPLVRGLVAALAPAVQQLAPGADPLAVARLVVPLPWLALVVPLGLLAVAGLGALVRRRRPVRHASTWGCGYPAASPAMQYSASSLAQPTTRVLQPALRTSVAWTPPAGLWPKRLSWRADTPERALAELYRPALARLAALLGQLRRMQEGQVMVYLRYVGLALLALFAWLLLPAGAPR
jgi:formate hydrogenlyase subunit 3/multisubunit Na+/H+ antiporter MnhD subunit